MAGRSKIIIATGKFVLVFCGKIVMIDIVGCGWKHLPSNRTGVNI